MMENKMFCYQCQETVGNQGCSQVGVCGKTPETAGLQDLLIDVTKGLAEVINEVRCKGKEINNVYDDQVSENLFITITNANFDDQMIIEAVRKTLTLKKELLLQLDDQAVLSNRALWMEMDIEAIEKRMQMVGVLETADEDIRSLKQLITYGLKGMAAYNKHAHALGFRKDEIDRFIETTLVKIETSTMSLNDYVALTMETGKYGVQVMELLDQANTCLLYTSPSPRDA